MIVQKKNIFLLLFILIQSHPVYKLNTLFYFDPVTSNKCDESNYWTPFNQHTTCFRFVNLEKDDNEQKDSIKIMLDHNIGYCQFSNYKQKLEELTSNWKRYNGKPGIIDEGTIFKIMNYTKKPNLSNKKTKPFHYLGYYYMNSHYINQGIEKNENGYWTETTYNKQYVYTVNKDGLNTIVEKTKYRGIRPVIKILKSQLNIITKEVDITTIMEKLSTIYKYPFEKKEYGDKKLIYKQLQGFTFTNDKLVFHSSNNDDRKHGILYSYNSPEFKTKYKTQYGTTGHGNGMTYNNKTKKFLICGPDEYNKLYQYDSKTFKHDQTYKANNTIPVFRSIGYDYNNDLYIGYYPQKIFFTKTKNFKTIYQFDIGFFETAQDLEYREGFIFMTTSELGAPNKYQSYSFYPRGTNLIYIYNAQIINGKPSKDFGRAVGRLFIGKKGELEGISFFKNHMFLGFATRKVDEVNAYTFYGINYKFFVDKARDIAKQQGSFLFDNQLNYHLSFKE